MGRISTAAQPQKRNADRKLAQSRLSVLELARELGNVVEACRQRGLDRTSFCEWKRRFHGHRDRQIIGTFGTETVAMR